MREIRFRGKRKDNGEWVYGHLIGSDVIVGEIVEFTEEYFYCEWWWRVDPETVGQYTGLKDKNGKEIYDGDILEERGSFDEIFHYEVIWSNADACLYFKGGDVLMASDIDFTLTEVIGNIYENWPDWRNQTMTRDEVLAMKPGRELDALVARKLFGVLNPDSRWRPSEDISAAWEVVEEMGDCLHLRQHGEQGEWEAWFCGYPNLKAHGETAPEAICKAALLAVMDGEDENERD